MWLSFDKCSSYAWSKIIKRRYLLSERTAGQRGFGGQGAATGGYLAARGGNRPAGALQRGHLCGITAGKSPTLLPVLLLVLLWSCWRSSPAQLPRHSTGHIPNPFPAPSPAGAMGCCATCDAQREQT